MKTSKWIPFTKDNFAAETEFQVRSKDTAPFSAVFNQFGQLLNADTRRIVSPDPAEMEVTEEKPESPAAPAKA